MWGVEVQLHSFLPVALNGDMWLGPRLDHFTPRESAPLYPKNRMVSGRQSCSEIFREEKYIYLVPGIEPLFLGCPARNTFTTLTALSWLALLCRRILYSICVQYLIISELKVPVQTVWFCCSCRLTSNKLSCGSTQNTAALVPTLTGFLVNTTHPNNPIVWVKKPGCGTGGFVSSQYINWTPVDF